MRSVCRTAGDLSSLDAQVKLKVCDALESEGCWENLAHGLSLGILNTAFRLSPSPAKTLLDSYEVMSQSHPHPSHLSFCVSCSFLLLPSFFSLQRKNKQKGYCALFQFYKEKLALIAFLFFYLANF